MNKLFLAVLFVSAVFFSADARYMRKVKEPDFFIPESDKMHKPEKLPQIKVVKVSEPQKKVKKEVFAAVPDYKTKYNKYLADMAVFVNTKTMPENAELDADLAAMKTGEVFEVTLPAPQKITTKEQKEFYILAKQILEN